MKPLTIILVLSSIFLLGYLFEKHDDLVNLSADKYEKCVMVEYGMTPSYYYELNNNYPECITK